MAWSVGVRGSSNPSDVSSHTITVPDGSNTVGNRVIVAALFDGNPTVTWPAGWTVIQAGVTTLNDGRLEVRYRDVTGTEPGWDGVNDTITLTTDVIEESGAIAYRTTGHAATAPAAATMSTPAVSSTSADPPSLAVGWSPGKLALWLPIIGANQSGAVSSGPTNYTDVTTVDTAGTGGVTISTAQRQLAAASEDPGPFTLANSRRVITTTLALEPSGATVTGSVALPGAGHIAIGGRVAHHPTVTAPGGGHIAVSGAVRHPSAVTVPGGGSIAVTGHVTVHASAVLNGGGSVSVTGQVNGASVVPPPGRVTAVDATFDMAERLLNCVGATLAGTRLGAPARTFVSPGAEIAWDRCECGQLTVHMLRDYPSDSFPILKQSGPFGRCEARLTVVEYVITILRCVPIQDGRGRPPSPGSMTAASRDDHEDRRAVRAGVACCFQTDDPRIPQFRLMQEQIAVGNDGECMGSELHVFIGFPNCAPCDEEA